MKVVVKLSGADVIAIEGDAEVEVRQYHRDFQDPDEVKGEDDVGPFELVWPSEWQPNL